MTPIKYHRLGCWLSVVGSMLSIMGCGGPKSYRSNIQAAYAYDRILAIREAGERRDPLAVPLLVDRLEDEDPAVRFYAILALERITGDRLGYRYEDSAIEQREAIDRWRQYARSATRNPVNSSGASTSMADQTPPAGPTGKPVDDR